MTCIGAGFILFFWGLIIGSVFIGILYGNGYDLADLQTGNIPEWFWFESFLSPPDLNQMAVMRGFGINNVNMLGYAFILPEFLNMGIILMVHIIWLIIPLILAYIFFKKRDI